MVISSEESQAHNTLMAHGRGETSGYPVEASEIAGASWFKSSRSAYNGSCVEVAQLSRGRIGVRDTKQHGMGPVLQFTQSEWTKLTARIRRGDLDFS